MIFRYDKTSVYYYEKIGCYHLLNKMNLHGSDI